MELAIYFLGVLLLGTFYYPLKSATGGGAWFVLSVFAYLLFVRLVGYGARRLTLSRQQDPNG